MEIDDRGTMLLRHIATELRNDPLQRVTLIAFTDNLGRRSFNLAISDERMNAVAEKLHALGVPKEQMRRESAGLKRLSQSCNTQACR